ncbi:unnamed protein product [Ixodes hexagonus]
MNSDVELPINATCCEAALILEFRELQALSPWTNVDLPDTSDQITFAHCHMSDDGTLDSFHVSRRVVLDFMVSEEVPVKATVYISGKKWNDEGLNTAKEAEHLLGEVGNLTLCPGCGLKPMSKSFSVSNGCYFATNCYLVSETACVACKYLRKLTQNTLSRKKKKASTSETQVSKTRTLWRMERKLGKLQKVVGEMKSQNDLQSKTEQAENQWPPL